MSEYKKLYHKVLKLLYTSKPSFSFTVFDPCKDNYHTLISNCVSCRCGSTQKQALDLHEPSKNIHSNASHMTGIANATQQAGLQQHHHQQTSSSASNSQHSQSGPEEPPLKLRITNVNTLPSSTIASSNNEPCNESEQIEIEPKIDYDELPSPSPPMHANSVVQQQHHQQQQQQQHPSTSTALTLTSTPTIAPATERKERMSKKQKEVYVNFLEQNPIINEHRRNDPALNRYWLKLADVLNSVPQGAVKHVAEWKQTFDNWRYRVFLYARYNSKISGEEALNPKCFKPLTMTDKRAYNIWIRNPDTAPPDLEHMRNVFMNLEEAPPE
uniref:Regulatory protein zeste n=1 Tax=Glossina pallidipes TaxID=7398 RepID=A0A1A9Z8X9_GLOPL